MRAVASDAVRDTVWHVRVVGLVCSQIPGMANARRLIRALLHKDELRRLGSHTTAGTQQIKNHAFFEGGALWALCFVARAYNH